MLKMKLLVVIASTVCFFQATQCEPSYGQHQLPDSQSILGATAGLFANGFTGFSNLAASQLVQSAHIGDKMMEQPFQMMKQGQSMMGLGGGATNGAGGGKTPSGGSLDGLPGPFNGLVAPFKNIIPGMGGSNARSFVHQFIPPIIAQYIPGGKSSEASSNGAPGSNNMMHMLALHQMMQNPAVQHHLAMSQPGFMAQTLMGGAEPGPGLWYGAGNTAHRQLTGLSPPGPIAQTLMGGAGPGSGLWNGAGNSVAGNTAPHHQHTGSPTISQNLGPVLTPNMSTGYGNSVQQPSYQPPQQDQFGNNIGGMSANGMLPHQDQNHLGAAGSYPHSSYNLQHANGGMAAPPAYHPQAQPQIQPHMAQLQPPQPQY